MACAAGGRPRGGLGLEAPDVRPGRALGGDDPGGSEPDNETDSEADVGGKVSG